VSRIYDALRKSEMENLQSAVSKSGPSLPAKVLSSGMAQLLELDGSRSVKIVGSPKTRLVALTDPHSLGAEKFRALATRIDNLRRGRELKSLQVTSGATNDGKTLTSGNLALTLARRSLSKVLLIEGDLHKPALASLFGLDQSIGLSQWWSEPDADIARFIRQLNGMSLWLLTAGNAYDQPSDILRSARFAKTFAELTRWFDWVIVDSTPLQPMVDANLWSRLVDGTLLVVREGVTPIPALKKGLQSLDNPKLIGVVLNEASEIDQVNQYYPDYLSQEKRGKQSTPPHDSEDVA
jgi:capsular exopolysaccharide synthesis family protein